VLDPMLFLGGFYLPPFHVKSEQSVEITTEDEVIVTGSMDVLVLKNSCRFCWSKKAVFSVEAGLAQILSYMLGNPAPDQPCFGMIATGGSFIFLKLVSIHRSMQPLSYLAFVIQEIWTPSSAFSNVWVNSLR